MIRLKRRWNSWQTGQIQIFAVQGQMGLSPQKYVKDVRLILKRKFHTGLRKSWWVFNDRLLLGRCILGFVLPVLEYCSAVWCSAADTHLKLLDCAVNGARFLTGGVFESDISHRQSVAVLCMLYKIRCNPVHPLNGALAGPYVPVLVTCSALVAPSLQNLAVQQDFYFPLGVPLERSC